jgi:hypothetical protein
MKLIIEAWKKFMMKESTHREIGPRRIFSPGETSLEKSVEETAEQFRQRKAAEAAQKAASLPEETPVDRLRRAMQQGDQQAALEASQTSRQVDRLRRAMSGESLESIEREAIEEIKKGKKAANSNVLEKAGIDPNSGKPRMGPLGAAYVSWLATEVIDAGFGDYLKKAIGTATGNERWKNIETKSFYEIPLEMQQRVLEEFTVLAEMPGEVDDFLTAAFYKHLGQPPKSAGLENLKSPPFQTGAQEQFLGSQEAAERMARLSGFEPTGQTYVPRGTAGTTVFAEPKPPGTEE